MVSPMRNRLMPGVAQLEYEIMRERAETLGRLGQRVERALAALRVYDEARGQAAPSSAAERTRRNELVWEAGEALWYFVIQRELTGFHDTAEVMRDLRVPKDVQACMGARPRRAVAVA